MLKPFACTVLGLLTLYTTSTCTADTTGDSRSRPAYARLFERVETLQQAGYLEQALRLLPGIYREEIPVDAFYATLERKKRELLAALKQTGMVKLNANCCSMADLRHLYADLVSSPELIHHRPTDPAAIPFDLYLYSQVALSDGKPTVQGENPVRKREAQTLKAIDSPDPWLTTTGLFMARKAVIGNKIRKSTHRWQRRPDLWDEATMQQALRLYARLSPDQLRALDSDIQNEDIRQALAGLKPIRSATCRLQPLMLNPEGEPLVDAAIADGDILLAEFVEIHVPPPMGGGVGEAPGLDKIGETSLRGRDLAPIPGRYRLRVVSEHFHGQSKHFRCSADAQALVPIRLYPNI